MSNTSPEISVAPSDINDTPPVMSNTSTEISVAPPGGDGSASDVRDAYTDVISATPQNSDSQPDVCVGKSDSPGEDNSPTDSHNDSTSEESSDNDSFRELFPGQKSKKASLSSESSLNLSKKSISSEELSDNENFEKQFSEKIKKASRTPSEVELLNVSITEKNENLTKKLFSPDNSSTSSQTKIHDFTNREERAKLINLVNILTEKLKQEHEENNNLKDIIQGQENEISTLHSGNLKFELELEEAEAVIRRTGLELEELKQKYVSLDKVYKDLQFLNITPNERFQHHPIEVYEFYRQESILSQKKSVQIKCLLDENKSLRNNILEVKNENADLRFKVRNLIEEDIDKKILNFTMEENRRLELKIKIQRDRHVNLGLEFKEQMDKTYDLEQKNESFKEKIETLEKVVKNNSLILAGNNEKDWETFSIDSEPEVDIAHSTQKTISPLQKESIEFQVKKALKDLLNNDIILPEGDAGIQVKKAFKELLNTEKNLPEVDKTNNKPVDKQTTPNTNSLNIQGSRVKTGQRQERSICKFYLQNRCIFGYKCRNIHSERPYQNQNYIPPWNPRIFPNGVSEPQNQTSFNPRHQQNPNPTYSVTGFRSNLGGKAVGYWSAPPIPVNQTRFSHLSELNLDGNNFPLLH